jgi:hypothetical protein
MQETLRYSILALVLSVLALGAKLDARVPTDSRIVGRAENLDGLVMDFLAALEQRDEEASRRLRFSETEYRHYVVPGNVAPGGAPQILDPEASA